VNLEMKLPIMHDVMIEFSNNGLGCVSFRPDIRRGNEDDMEHLQLFWSRHVR